LGSPGRDGSSVRCEDLHAVVALVRHVHGPRPVRRDAGRSLELPRPRSA
jgi:hypothetical protein